MPKRTSKQLTKEPALLCRPLYPLWADHMFDHAEPRKELDCARNTASHQVSGCLSHRGHGATKLLHFL